MGVSLDAARNRDVTNPINELQLHGAICVLASQEDEQIARHTWALLPHSAA
jgi:acetate kinase